MEVEMLHISNLFVFTLWITHTLLTVYLLF
jgi:hypothetical protein